MIVLGFLGFVIGTIIIWTLEYIGKELQEIKEILKKGKP